MFVNLERMMLSRIADGAVMTLPSVTAEIQEDFYRSLLIAWNCTVPGTVPARTCTCCTVLVPY